MKTKQFLHSFFGVFMLVIFMASFTGCSDDDDDNDNNNAQTYLELYEGSTWELDDTGGVPDLESIPAYFRFVNNANIILEGWYRPDMELDCYYYVNGINVDGGNMSVTENTETKLVIKITYGATETETFTCTVKGDVLTIGYLYEEDGAEPEAYAIDFNKTTVDVDALPLCPM